MRISDWSSDVCSSDLVAHAQAFQVDPVVFAGLRRRQRRACHPDFGAAQRVGRVAVGDVRERGNDALCGQAPARAGQLAFAALRVAQDPRLVAEDRVGRIGERLELEFATHRSEEHTSELQSLMRISYAVFCLKKKKNDILKIQLLTPTSHYIP